MRRPWALYTAESGNQMNKLEVTLAVRSLFDIDLGKARSLVEQAEEQCWPVFTIPNSDLYLRDMDRDLEKQRAFFRSIRALAQNCGVIT